MPETETPAREDNAVSELYAAALKANKVLAAIIRFLHEESAPPPRLADVMEAQLAIIRAIASAPDSEEAADAVR